MKNALRLLVLSGTLALLASPAAFADGPISGAGPGGNNPPPPPTGTGTTTTSTTNTTSTGTTTTIVSEILTILGAVGL